MSDDEHDWSMVRCILDEGAIETKTESSYLAVGPDGEVSIGLCRWYIAVGECHCLEEMLKQ